MVLFIYSCSVWDNAIEVGGAETRNLVIYLSMMLLGKLIKRASKRVTESHENKKLRFSEVLDLSPARVSPNTSGLA